MQLDNAMKEASVHTDCRAIVWTLKPLLWVGGGSPLVLNHQCELTWSSSDHYGIWSSTLSARGYQHAHAYSALVFWSGDPFFTLSTPLSTHTSLKDYAQIILCCFDLGHFANGSDEVHLLWSLEQKFKDDTTSLSSEDKHTKFTYACAIHLNWRDCLAWRQRKRDFGIVLGAVPQAFCGDYI